MTIIVPRQLAEAVSKLGHAIERSSPNPMLGFIHITADDGKMELMATDLDIRLNTWIDCQGELGPICVDAARLSAALARIKDRGEARLEAIAGSGPNSDVLRVTSGRSEFNLPTLPADGFPKLQEPSEAEEFVVSGPAFRQCLAATLVSVSSEETRYYLCGVAMQPGDLADAKCPDHLVFISTDSHKGMARHMAAPDLPSIPSIIIPTKTVQVIGKVFDKAETLTLSVGTSGHRMRVNGGTTEMVTKLIEGTFPDWRRVMPGREPVLAYDAKGLAASVETAAAVTGTPVSKQGKPVKLTFSKGETELTTTDLDNPTFSGKDICAHQELTPVPVEIIGMNYKYLIEMIAALDCETVEMCITEAGGQILLTGAALDDRRAVIMPMRF